MGRQAAVRCRGRARAGLDNGRPRKYWLLVAAVLTVFVGCGLAGAQGTAAAPAVASGNKTGPVLAPVAAPKGSPGPVPSSGAGVGSPSPVTQTPAPAPSAVLTPGPVSSGMSPAPLPKPGPSPAASPVQSPSPVSGPAGSGKASGGVPTTPGPPASSTPAPTLGGRLLSIKSCSRLRKPSVFRLDESRFESSAGCFARQSNVSVPHPGREQDKLSLCCYSKDSSGLVPREQGNP